MNVSYKWLKDYVDFELPPEELGRRLSHVGLVCEALEAVGDDFRLVLEVTANRPDCLCHLGVAREVAAIVGGRMKPPAAEPEEYGPDVDGLTNVEIEARDLCPRYTARVVQGVSVAPSPGWLADRLEAVGLRPVNNVVDITNYVMFECGQPLHAFDYDKLRENRIVVRRGRAGEEMVSIDETTCKLDPEMLLIADAARPVAVAGVMGGLDTEVSDSSGNILLESAFFDPASIRRTSRRLGLPSDSCYRFERRVDPATVEWASRRAAGLIVELAGGKLARGVVDANYMDIEPWEVVLRIPRVETVLGIPVPKAEACRILEALQLEVVEDEGDSIRVRVPVFRADLTREIDLIEEVARIHGYDRIPVETRATVRFTVRDDELKVGDQLRSVLSGLGYSEALTNCFMDNSEPHRLNPWKAGEPAELMNPVSSEKTHLRRSLMPGLLQAVRLNQNRTEEPVSLFELGTVYLPGLGGDKWRTDRPGEEQRPLEKLALGLVTGQEDGVAHMKGTLGVVCERLHVRERLSYAASDLQCFDDGMGIEARIGGQVLAVLGPVGSKWRQSLDLNGSPTVAELDADLLVRAADLSTTFEHLPSFPAVNRDLAVVLDESVEWASVEACVRRSATDLLEALEFMSEYRGEQIAAGKKSLAFSLSFRSSERTLTSEEVDEVQKSILAALESELGAKLR